MENFPTVLAICRTAMRSPSATLTRNIGKLRDALGSQGHEDQAEALSVVLAGKRATDALAPSRVVLARATVERMTRSVHAPVDKESGAPLASIIFPGDAEQGLEPILEADLGMAIEALVSEWQSAGMLLDAGIRPPLNLLLYGAPGTGKTALAKVIAAQMKLPLVTARLDGLISSFLGTTARNIANLFEFANRYECILLLDEFDAVAKIRDDPHELGEIKRVVNTLLQCLDERRERGFTIAITNHEHLLDAAIWRRFDSRVAIPRPGAGSRRRMVARFLNGVAVEDVDIDFLAWLTDGRSGAEIETLCSSIKRYLVMNGTGRKSLLEALKVNLLLSADHSDSPRQDMFAEDFEGLVRKLSNDEEIRFTQESLARLFNTTQSTISRWIRK
ncbi:AAA family ATPase [Paenarthrobacter sp. CM16]|uniref:AAA family ATPase n=1 Tax=Paenarthrobacter sp. CM16 TaxID=2738447 RepID=UPI0015541804|nr:ATP-binding protein [Paenarthrobacter sp. CM16]NQD89479.1 AAA family ATPase [Paenarthrobacter sp. CM16]